MWIRYHCVEDVKTRRLHRNANQCTQPSILTAPLGQYRRPGNEGTTLYEIKSMLGDLPDDLIALILAMVTTGTAGTTGTMDMEFFKLNRKFHNFFNNEQFWGLACDHNNYKTMFATGLSQKETYVMFAGLSDDHREKLKALDNQTTVIPAWHFANAHFLTIKKLPPKVTTIGAYAFTRCKSLKELEAHELTTVYDGAFEDCRVLKKFDAHKLTTIRMDAFKYCEKLKEFITLKLETVGEHGFESCRELETFIAHKLAKVEAHTFRDCVALKKFESHNLKTICVSAFSGCIELREFTAHKLSIGQHAFKDCGKLKEQQYTYIVTENDIHST
jgi:hypothetical protein